MSNDPQPIERNLSARQVLLIIIPVLLLAAVLLVAVELIGVDQLHATVQAAGPWAPAIFVGVKILTYVVAPLSGGPLQIVAGTIFGLWEGVALTLLGDTVGGCINFTISRLFGRRLVIKLAGRSGMNRIDKFSEQIGGWRALFFARLFLMSVYDFISYAAGLSQLKFVQYAIVTVIAGILPTILFVGLGATLAEDRLMSLVIFGLLAILFLIPVIYMYRKTRRSDADIQAKEGATKEDTIS